MYPAPPVTRTFFIEQRLKELARAEELFYANKV